LITVAAPAQANQPFSAFHPATLRFNVFLDNVEWIINERGFLSRAVSFMEFLANTTPRRLYNLSNRI
jgi:hypothetical protein